MAKINRVELEQRKRPIWFVVLVCAWTACFVAAITVAILAVAFWALLVVLILFVSALVFLGVLLMTGSRVLYVEGAAIAKPGGFDAEKHKMFIDALESVSIGRGLDPPPLYVLSLPIAMAGARGDPYKRMLYVTPELLSLPLTYYEIEGIAAVLLAKLMIEPGCNYHKLAEDLRLDPEIKKRALGFLGPFGGAQIAIVFQDTYAARETGQPAALSSAIRKCGWAVRTSPIKVHVSDVFALSDMFVQPPISGPLGIGQSVKTRDSQIGLRVQNLEVLAGGAWHDEKEVESGSTLAPPDGWE